MPFPVLLDEDGTAADIVGTASIGPTALLKPGQFAAGFRSIYRYDGSSWLTVKHDESSSFGGVWGSGPNDVWAAGWPPELNADSAAARMQPRDDRHVTFAGLERSSSIFRQSFDRGRCFVRHAALLPQ